MSLVQYYNFRKRVIFLHVSIHYMSLVQLLYISDGDELDGFQYIICRWFNTNIEKYQNKSFMFQYIICRWFKVQYRGNSYELINVSIHYMSLVQ